jgi:hypothetical protein
MSYTMPFGRYKGWLLSEIDDGYIAWLYALDNLRQPLRDRVDEEFERRRRRDAESPVARNGKPPERTMELIDVGFKTLARKYHPDVGGSNAEMRESLEARAWLVRQANEAHGID